MDIFAQVFIVSFDVIYIVYNKYFCTTFFIDACSTPIALPKSISLCLIIKHNGLQSFLQKERRRKKQKQKGVQTSVCLPTCLKPKRV